MRLVTDADGTRYFVCKRSSDATLVRDPATGERRYLPNDDLEELDGESALEVAASGVDPAVRALLRAVHDDDGLGLLIELTDRGPLAARTLLERYDYCESDLHGRLLEYRLAGLLEEATVAGERGYRASDDLVDALSILRPAYTDESGDPADGPP
ncbi:DUF7346 family protein [Natronobiforma cellulositropha]|uniref:DUF7346 family protein n=1 Tax=Natronobiforma cellulositropha TaxID=1679076 RepID=UPI0021D602E5|nr:hypothetical protein [Natronobiforma cellulositropha]